MLAVQLRPPPLIRFVGSVSALTGTCPQMIHKLLSEVLICCGAQP